MTIEERKNIILAKIAEIKQGGTDEEKQDIQNAALEQLSAVVENENREENGK